MELFDRKEIERGGPGVGAGPDAPLAERMRPSSFEEFFGQTHLVSEEKFLMRVSGEETLPSLILWGPPGSGKTTLANIVASLTKAHFVSFSAVLAGVKEVREVVKQAKADLARGEKTVLFVDEIHRFNKAQQDAFLHHVEDGTITLIGATTENPSFEVNPPLLSRCKVLVLKKLSEGDIKAILERAVSNSEKGLGRMKADIEDGVIDLIAEASDGDARCALNALETAYMIAAVNEEDVREVSLDTAAEAMQRKALLYDKGGEEHYNVISAFIKSMRGSDPDAALYWLARMVEAGEDPLFIARRMVIFASEDIGNADPRALTVALGVKESVHFVGMPEGWIPLAQGATFLATAPKSNASYTAYKRAARDVKEKGALDVPTHLRNAPTKLMKELGYSKGYQYPHDAEGGYVEEDYLPEGLRKRKYYEPTDRGYDRKIKEMMEERKKTKGKKK